MASTGKATTSELLNPTKQLASWSLTTYFTERSTVYDCWVPYLPYRPPWSNPFGAVEVAMIPGGYDALITTPQSLRIYRKHFSGGITGGLTAQGRLYNLTTGEVLSTISFSGPEFTETNIDAEEGVTIAAGSWIIPQIYLIPQISHARLVFVGILEPGCDQ
jgi:hypothetical protein